MFKLVAFIFLVTNGITAEESSTSIRNKRSFPSEEACLKFIDSEDGKIAKSSLDAMLAAQSVPMEAKLSCVHVEDNSI